MQPKVSVIMPVYNVERYIRESIESVLNQTFTDFELIIVNDGSPDKCPQICDEYSKKDDRVKVIHKKNGGVSSARNIGVEVSIGEYVQFVDSDDVIESNTIADLVNLAQQTNVDVVIFGITSFNLENGETVSVNRSNNIITEFETKQQVKDNFAFLVHNYLWSFSVDKLYKREIIVKNKIQFDSFYNIAGEDAIFLIDLLPHITSMYITNKNYYNYYIRNNQSVVKKFKQDLFEKYYFRLLKTKALIETFEYKQDNFDMLYKMYCEFIIWSYEQLFHKDCKYNMIQSYQYIKNTFSIDRTSQEFRNNAYRFMNNSNLFCDYSRSSRLIVKNIFKRRYIFVWLFHIISKFKNKGCEKSCH